MELSGLIFVALALVWAVVLIPKALRHHDEVARTRPVQHVSDGVRVVSRRGATAVAATAPPTPVAASSPAERAVHPSPVGHAGSRRTSAGHRAAARAAARRRRRVLTVLLLPCVGIAVAASLGILLLWAPAIPVAVVVGFLVLARVSVRREQARWERAVASRRTAVPATAEADSAPVAEADLASSGVPVAAASSEAPVETEVEERNDQGLNVVSGLDDTSAIPVVTAEWSGVPASGSVWDPVPVTLPTYVTKPRAARAVRTIDLGAPDVSSSGRDAAASALVAEAATSGAAGDAAPRAVGS